MWAPWHGRRPHLSTFPGRSGRSGLALCGQVISGHISWVPHTPYCWLVRYTDPIPLILRIPAREVPVSVFSASESMCYGFDSWEDRCVLPYAYNPWHRHWWRCSACRCKTQTDRQTDRGPGTLCLSPPHECVCVRLCVCKSLHRGDR